MCEIRADAYQILDSQAYPLTDSLLGWRQRTDDGLGEHEHFMLKEIFEQPARLRDTVTHGR